MMRRLIGLVSHRNRHGFCRQGSALIICPFLLLTIAIGVVGFMILRAKQSPEDEYTFIELFMMACYAALGFFLCLFVVAVLPSLYTVAHRALFPELVPIEPSGVAPDDT